MSQHVLIASPPCSAMSLFSYIFWMSQAIKNSLADLRLLVKMIYSVVFSLKLFFVPTLQYLEEFVLSLLKTFPMVSFMTV